MKRLLLVACLAVGSGCALLSNVASGNVSGAVNAAANEAQDAAALAQRVERDCGPLKKQEVSWEQEQALGGAVAVKLTGNTKGVFIEPSPALPAGSPFRPPAGSIAPGSGPKTDLTVWVNQVGKALASSSSRPTIPWKFMVVESEEKNAYSAPGGYVLITTGLLQMLENEAQLAAVLGHEIAHVTGRHALEFYKQTRHSQCVTQLNAAYAAQKGQQAARSALPSGANAMLNMAGAFGFDFNSLTAEAIRDLTDGAVNAYMNAGPGQEQELEADRIAVELAFFHGYDVREYAKVLEKLPNGGALSPHPSTKDRVANLNKVIADLGGGDGLKAPAIKTRLSAIK